MAKKATAAQKKMEKVMHEWKAGSLHIGKSKKVVPASRQDQAVAIGLRQSGQSGASRSRKGR